jgi:hypothetical protein
MFLYKQKKTLKTKNTNNTNTRINFDKKKKKKTSKVPFPHKQTTFTTNKKPTSLKLENQSFVVLEAL